ncbi:MAG TPA: hypothetical protein PKJ45_01560 [Rubrivivax sp.]|nr:hypothetical protein [Rubrivivax sp.]
MRLLRPFALLVRAARAFFRADLRLRRGERGIEVVLDESRPAVPVRVRGRRAARADAAAQKVQQELELMRGSLAALLDEMPGNRTTLRHLAFVEHALQRKGARALAKLPYAVLQRALEQFEGVVVNWSDEGLATLRSKMAVTLIEREAEAGDDMDPLHAGAAATSMLDAAALTHPGDDEDETAAAEAALRAAYGEVMLPALQLEPMPDTPAGLDVEVQGELHSPSGRAIAKAIRRGDEEALRPSAALHS